jgi:dTDP-4-dehydrorhamnose reductase
MSAADRFLVIGGNSLIGGHLLRRWQEQGREVRATTRRQASQDAALVPLDLANDLTDWTPPFSGGVALLCAANANQNQCRRDPDSTRHLNVTQTIRLARRLLDHDYFLVFLSSNAVFDGAKARCQPNEPVNPMTEYGRQKAEVEAAFLEMPGRAAVIRLGKVVHGDLPVFQSWRESLSAGKVIHPFSDYICSPISLAQTVDCISKIVENRFPGIWHVSPQDDISYAAMARLLADKGGFPSALVIPETAPAGLLEHLPQHAALDVKQTERKLGIQFESAGEVIQNL